MVSDGKDYSSEYTFTMNVEAVNDKPVISSIETENIDYTENDGAVVISSTLLLSDVDNTNLTGASITISSNYVSTEDGLSFEVLEDGITIVSNTDGVLVLTGASSLENYQTALRRVKYTNSSELPSEATRTISFKVSDGITDSEVVSRDIDITSVNDIPAITDQDQIILDEDTEYTILLDDVTVSDKDDSNFTIEVFEGDNYTFQGNKITPKSDLNGDLRINVQVHDGEAYSLNYKFLISYTAINDPPVITNDENPSIIPEATIRIGGKIGATVGTWNDDKDNPAPAK